MTPSEIREELVAIQERIRAVEQTAETQNNASVGYQLLRHELVEAWEAVDRAVDQADEMEIGLL